MGRAPFAERNDEKCLEYRRGRAPHWANPTVEGYWASANSAPTPDRIQVNARAVSRGPAHELRSHGHSCTANRGTTSRVDQDDDWEGSPPARVRANQIPLQCRAAPCHWANQNSRRRWSHRPVL